MRRLAGAGGGRVRRWRTVGAAPVGGRGGLLPPSFDPPGPATDDVNRR
ncbi:hypothetical protein ATKI12_2847 [Kitasatospora sp. Ki12]